MATRQNRQPAAADRRLGLRCRLILDRLRTVGAHGSVPAHVGTCRAPVESECKKTQFAGNAKFKRGSMMMCVNRRLGGGLRGTDQVTLRYVDIRLRLFDV